MNYDQSLTLSRSVFEDRVTLDYLCRANPQYLFEKETDYAGQSATWHLGSRMVEIDLDEAQ